MRRTRPQYSTYVGKSSKIKLLSLYIVTGYTYRNDCFVLNGASKTGWAPRPSWIILRWIIVASVIDARHWVGTRAVPWHDVVQIDLTGCACLDRFAPAVSNPRRSSDWRFWRLWDSVIRILLWYQRTSCNHVGLQARGLHFRSQFRGFNERVIWFPSLLLKTK